MINQEDNHRIRNVYLVLYHPEKMFACGRRQAIARDSFAWAVKYFAYSAHRESITTLHVQRQKFYGKKVLDLEKKSAKKCVTTLIAF